MSGELASNRRADALIAARAASLPFGRLLLAEGQAVVGLDGQAIVADHPDGSRVVIGRIDTPGT